MPFHPRPGSARSSAGMCAIFGKDVGHLRSGSARSPAGLMTNGDFAVKCGRAFLLFRCV